MFHLQLKQIRVAIDAGRLDEAMNRLDQSTLRDHRDAQQMVDQLVDRFLERGQSHLAAGRLQQARSDAEKARRLAGETEKVSELVERVSRLQQQQGQDAKIRRHHEKAAEDQIRQGNLTLGEKLLPSPDSTRDICGDPIVTGDYGNKVDGSLLGEEIQRLRMVADEIAGRVASLVDAGDVASAVMIVNSVESAVRQQRLVAEQVARLVEPTLKQATKELCDGRLDRAIRLVKLIQPIASCDPGWIELMGVLEECRIAFRAISNGSHSQGIVSLRRVETVLGKQSWLVETIAASEQIQTAMLAIRSGPLGFTEHVCLGDLEQLTSNSEPKSAAVFALTGAEKDGVVGGTNRTLLLRVDGVGGILLLPSPAISIGSGGTSRHLDVPILTDGPRDPLRIRRTGEDYFIESDKEFELNDQPTKFRLLNSGDSIQFGRRGRLKFIRPVAASGSAVLRLSGAGLARREIRHLALMDDSLVFSPQGGHFPLPQGGTPVVLFRNPTGYALKYAGVGGEHQDLIVGESVLFGDTQFSLNPVSLS